MFAIAVGIGILTSVQSRVNGGLSVLLGNGLQAALVSYSVGLIIMLGFLCVLPTMRLGLIRVFSALRKGQLPWWQILGGVIGGFFVAAQSTTVPVLGVAIFAVAVVAGQSTSSLLVDRVGLGSANLRPFTARRAFAALLAVIAVAVAASDRFTDIGPTSLTVIVPAFVAGLLIAVQQSINATVGIVSRSSLSATGLNSALGTVFLIFSFFISVLFFKQPATPLLFDSGWIYLGGAIGLISIGGAVWAVPKLGILSFTLLLIAGQLIGALFLDFFLPSGGYRVTWAEVVGILMTFLAVSLSTRDPIRTGQV